MEEIKNYYKRFVTEGFDENGILNKFELSCPENFNFAYDIIDRFGELDPDRPAMWICREMKHASAISVFPSFLPKPPMCF